MQRVFAKILLITAFITSLPISIQATADAPEDNELEQSAWDSTFANTIFESNINSVPYESRDSSSWTFEEFAKNLYRDTTKPLQRVKRIYAFNVYKADEAERGSRMKNIPLTGIDATVWEDLNLLVGQKNRSQYVAKTALPTRTELGMVHSCITLTQPTHDIAILHKRQELIKALVNNQELLTRLQATLNDFAHYENILCNFWEQTPWLGKTLDERNFYNKDLTPFLNYSAVTLAPKQLHDLATTSAFGALHFIAGLTILIDVGARICGKKDFQGIPGLASVNASISQLNGGLIGNHVTDFFYNTLGTCGAVALGSWLSVNGGYQAYQALKSAKGFWIYSCVLEKIIRRLAHDLRAYKALTYLVAADPILAKHPDLKAFITVSNNKKLHEAFKLADDPGFDLVDDTANVLNLGTGLAMMRYFLDVRSSMSSGLVALGALDMYVACAENIIKHPGDWCYASYITAEKPLVDAQDFWHPLIQHAPVKNSITLGTNDHRPHAIITGANAGGKSTAMKAITLSVLCAQTLSICPARSVTLTPFRHIKTYLNIKDDLGEGNSLFRAEVQRAQNLLNCISKAAPNGFVFTIFDEVFKGTSTQEGPAAAWATANEIGRYTNCICLIATHFPVLTHLETASELFTNYRIPILRNGDDNFTYTFKLEPGVSQDHIAFDILRSEGFTGEIIDEATCIMRSLQNVEETQEETQEEILGEISAINSGEIV